MQADEMGAVVGAATRQIKDEADRLGLKWQMRTAEVTDTTFTTDLSMVMARYDGDSESIPMSNAIGGSIANGMRVFVIEVPPSGNYIVGSTRGAIYRATQRASTAVASLEFANIPTDLASLQITYTARLDAGGLVEMRVRVNNDATAARHRTSNMSWAGAGYNAPAQSAGTSWLAGLVGGNNTPLVFNGGSITINNWNAVHTVNGYLNYEFTSSPYVDGVNSFGSNGGGSYVGASPYSRLLFFPSGGNFDIGTQIELVGFY